MIDVKLPLRKAYYSLLSGNITYNSQSVPISSDIKKLSDNAAQTYVIISGQSGADRGTLSSFDSQEQIILDIVCKAQTRVNKETIDSIANQILALVIPSPYGNGLPAQVGINIQCVQLINDRYLDLVINSGSTVNRRLLTFTQKVRQTSGIGSAPTLSNGVLAQVTNETPAGLINSTNKVYTSAYPFVSGSVDVYVNGLRQVPGVHFTYSLPNTITFVDAPQTSDNILIDYIRSS